MRYPIGEAEEWIILTTIFMSRDSVVNFSISVYPSFEYVIFASLLLLSASDVLKLYEDPLPDNAPDSARKVAVDKKNAELIGLFSDPTGWKQTAPVPIPILEGLPSSSSSLGRDPEDITIPVNVMVDTADDSGVNLDTATDLSRSPWTQTASPFISDRAPPSTSSAKAPVAMTSTEVNARRKAKAAANKSPVGVTSKQVESVNDVEWIVDAYSADTPESSEAAVRGMSSSGRSVNRRRMQQEQQKLQSATQLNVQESRILKARLDELRKANGLFVSEPINEDAEKKLIDFFKK